MAKKFLQFIRKRNGKVVAFQPQKITQAICKAMKDINITDDKTAINITEEILHNLKKKFGLGNSYQQRNLVK